MEPTNMTTFDFNPNTTRWQARNALALAKASQLAYEKAASIDAITKTWGLTRSHFITTRPGNRWDTQCFVASNSNMVLVAFRGTEPDHVKDWITDADVIMAQTELGAVHYGFWTALAAIWEELLQT